MDSTGWCWIGYYECNEFHRVGFLMTLYLHFSTPLFPFNRSNMTTSSYPRSNLLPHQNLHPLPLLPNPVIMNRKETIPVNRNSTCISTPSSFHPLQSLPNKLYLPRNLLNQNSTPRSPNSNKSTTGITTRRVVQHNALIHNSH